MAIILDLTFGPSDKRIFVHVSFVLSHQVVLSANEVKAGLKLAPVQKEVTITDQPVHNIKFSQFRATIAGTITCLGQSVLLRNDMKAS